MSFAKPNKPLHNIVGLKEKREEKRGQIYFSREKINSMPAMADNKALHLTAIPLRSIAAGELSRWADRRRMNCRPSPSKQQGEWRVYGAGEVVRAVG